MSARFYVNDNTLNSVYNAFSATSGLSTARGIANLTSFANNPTAIPTPPFAIPTTTLDQFNLSPKRPPCRG
jgi:hypothetical protein